MKDAARKLGNPTRGVTEHTTQSLRQECASVYDTDMVVCGHVSSSPGINIALIVRKTHPDPYGDPLAVGKEKQRVPPITRHVWEADRLQNTPYR